MIKSGWNILRFIRADESPNTRLGAKFYDAFKFIAVNLANEDIEFVYLVPVGTKRSNLIRDLILLTERKLWVDVELMEQNKLLRIKSMREVKNAQAEYDFMKQKLKGRVQ